MGQALCRVSDKLLRAADNLYLSFPFVHQVVLYSVYALFLDKGHLGLVLWLLGSYLLNVNVMQSFYQLLFQLINGRCCCRAFDILDNPLAVFCVLEISDVLTNLLPSDFDIGNTGCSVKSVIAFARTISFSCSYLAASFFEANRTPSTVVGILWYFLISLFAASGSSLPEAAAILQFFPSI